MINVIELRWLQVPTGYKHAICLGGECRILQYRTYTYTDTENADDDTVFSFPIGGTWSAWQDVPVVQKFPS